MADASVLRQAVNHFSTFAGFTPVAATGGVDTVLYDTVIRALTAIALGGNGISDAVADQASQLQLAIRSPEQLQQNMSVIATYLTSVAMAMGMTSGQVAPVPVPAAKFGLVASVKDAWAKLPMPAKVAGGVATGLGLLFVGSRLLRKRPVLVR